MTPKMKGVPFPLLWEKERIDPELMSRGREKNLKVLKEATGTLWFLVIKIYPSSTKLRKKTVKL
jgi:hypothetical protein